MVYIPIDWGCELYNYKLEIYGNAKKWIFKSGSPVFEYKQILTDAGLEFSDINVINSNKFHKLIV